MFKSLYQFLRNEDGNYTVELSLLFPVIVMIAMFFVDNNLYYDGLISTASSTNEALRYAITANDETEATEIIKKTLSERLSQAKVGWCTSEGIAKCHHYGDSIRMTSSLETFQSNPAYNLLVTIDEKGWCNGSYITVGIRTHKASLIPSYSTFRRMVNKGGSIYHQYTYTFKGRIESNTKCA